MSSIEFNQDNTGRRIQSDAANNSFMARILIKKGFAKDLEQANLILISISLIFFIITMVVILFTFFYSPKPASNSNNDKIIKEYKDQGLRGKELSNKIREAMKTGLIK